jgi:quinone-modifying oxidoreductase subunit QmoB
MEKNIGVYICKGCGIGDVVDVEEVKKEAQGKPKVPKENFKMHDALCSPEGIAMIKSDISAGINCVNIAACSPRVKYEEFDFPGTFVERTNIRELVAWTQDKPEEGSEEEEYYSPTLSATDYVTMGIIKLQKGEIPEPNILGEEEGGLSKRIMVVGGGITGLTAALEAEAAGYEVVLVEKEKTLGGWNAKLYKSTPLAPPLDALVETPAAGKIAAVEAAEGITVYTGTTIEKTEGQPGLFDVTLTNGKTEKIGSFVMAAGFTPYDASKLTHLGSDKADVVTSVEFEEMAKTGKITRPSDGKEAKRVAFILCAGSRDANHLAYCSGFCCGTALKQAMYVRELNDGAAYVFYRDIRMPGQSEIFYKNVQDDPGIMFTKADVTGVSNGGSSLFVEAENTLLGEKIKVEADLVVLATGIVPATAGIQSYLDGVTEAGTDGDEAKEKYIEENVRPDGILNLEYKQGPEVPSLENAYGFADSSFICFQYETRRTGVYAAGSIRQPMNSNDASEDAAGAALKAIQCVEHVAQGIAVHPRSWDASYPDPQMTRCTSCKRCTDECPFGAIDEDEKGTPFFKINRCRRCATCMGACPERIVSFKDFHVDMVGSMLKSIEVPDEGMRVIVLACENDAYPALDTAAKEGFKFHPGIRIIPVRCLGATNLVWVADAFSRGIDGIILLGCKFGENYQCHFVKGSELAENRFSKVQETLDRLQLESERCVMEQVAIDEYDVLAERVNSIVRNIEDELGPNPFKGF